MFFWIKAQLPLMTSDACVICSFLTAKKAKHLSTSLPVRTNMCLSKKISEQPFCLFFCQKVFSHTGIQVTINTMDCFYRNFLSVLLQTLMYIFLFFLFHMLFIVKTCCLYHPQCNPPSPKRHHWQGNGSQSNKFMHPIL